MTSNTSLRAQRGNWPFEFPGINWIGKEEEKAVVDVVRKGSLFRYYGPQAPTHVARLEDWARQYHGVQHALAVNSGTGALCTTMSALQIGPGDEVIVPAFLWVSTITAIIQCNAIGFSLIATSISGPITALLSLRRTAWCTSCRTKG